jgi:hypothetical protein
MDPIRYTDGDDTPLAVIAPRILTFKRQTCEKRATQTRSRSLVPAGSLRSFPHPTRIGQL